MIEHRLTRRAFAGAGLASAGLFMTSGARAFADRTPTVESPMGPFYPIVRPTDSDVDLTWVKGRDARAAGQVIEISGRVYDVKGNPLPGATLELWQANADGRTPHLRRPAPSRKSPPLRLPASGRRCAQELGRS